MSTEGSVNAAKQRHPFRELADRYRAIFKAAWDAREQLAGPLRLADERAFLPAAMALQETPPHPAPRRAALAICLLFLIALLWACFGQIDIVAVAQGRIKVSDGSKLIQPLETSVVRAILIKDGDHVHAGQLLIELDPTLAEADKSRVAQERASAISEALRTTALLDAMVHNAPPRLAPDVDLPQTDRLAAQAQLSSEWADIQAKLSRLQAEADKFRAEARTVDQQIDKLETTLPMSRQRESDFKTLSDQGFMASHAGQDRTRERVEMEKDLATQRARKLESVASLHASEQAYAAQKAETVRNLRERQAEARLKRQQLEAESSKAALRTRLTRLTAPVSGTVQQLAIHTSGGVVTPAQTLLVVVPERAEVTAEVTLENKDIGFVREGQRAEVKLETFPYTRYGTVSAAVIQVAADAVVNTSESRQSNASGPQSTEKPLQGAASFPATLRLGLNQINVDGKLVHLSPGMNVTAEIKTGRRRVIEYLLSPIQQHLGDSLRER